MRRVRLDADPPAVDTLVETTGCCLWDAALDDQGEIWVADGTLARPGLRVFDAASGAELTDAPLDVGLPPFSVCLAD